MIDDQKDFIQMLSSCDESNDDFSSNLKVSNYFDDSSYLKVYKDCNSTNHFKVLSFNCDGLRSKFDEFSARLHYYRSVGVTFEAICLQETGLDSFTNILPYQLDNYQLIFQTKTASMKGGLIIYLSNEFTYKRINVPKFTNSIWEFMCIEVSHPSLEKSRFISNIYRPPHNSLHDTGVFLEELHEVLDKFQNSANFAIFGDYNIDLLKLEKSQLVKKFVDLMFSLGYLPQITSPTRFTSHSATLIDNVFCKFSELWEGTVSGILINRISDHQQYFTHFPTDKKIKQKPKIVEYRKITDKGIADFIEYLSNNRLFESTFNDALGVNENYDNKDKLAPWMTNGILRSIKTRDKLHKKLLLESVSSPIYSLLEAQLRHHRIILRRIIFLAKQTYWSNRFLAARNNIKQTWHLINNAINSKTYPKLPDSFDINGQVTTDASKIADEFNMFFVNVGKNLASQITTSTNSTHFENYLKNDYTQNDFKFGQVTASEVDKVISQLPNKFSHGYDGFSINFIKKIKNVIIEPLTSIFNQTIRSGIFPDSLKMARVLPVYKKGDKCLLDNYRPISILPALSKIFERLIFNQLIEYLTEHKILFNSQYGFRSGHSTEHAALELVERILTSFSNNDQSLAIFLDLSKAFDSLNHEILISKLKYYGLSTQSLQLISSYFENRFQYVDFNGTHSRKYLIETGVPQGSVLGPLFFLLYLNDLNEVSNIFDFIMFADDTTLHCPLSRFSNNYTDTTSNLINKELDNIFSWFCANKLTINASKTKLMIFHRPNASTLKLSISINNEVISQVSNFEFLGVNMNENLSWSKHISNTCSKIASAIGMMHRLRGIFPKNVLTLIYHSLITSRLNYMLTVWGGDFDRIFILQKKALRIIHGTKYNAHCDPLFATSNILKIHDQYKVNLLKLGYHILNSTCPKFFSRNKISLREEIHSHDTRNKKLFHIPLIKFNYLRRTLFYRVGEVTNEFPKEIISKISTHHIQNIVSRLKKCLISKYNSIICTGCYVCRH